MKTEIKTQSYVSSITAQGLRFELERKKTIVNSLASALQKHGELPTLETMREYQTHGADFKRRVVIDELEAYIAKVGMPAYLQESARAEALQQVNNRLISEVGDILDGIDFDLIPDHLQYDEGRHEWKFTEAFITAYLAPSLKTLTDDEQRDFELLIELLKAFETVKSHGYNVVNILRNGSSDTAPEVLAERLIGSRNATDMSDWALLSKAMQVNRNN